MNILNLHMSMGCGNGNNDVLIACPQNVYVCKEYRGDVGKLTLHLFFIEPVGYKVCVLQGIFVFLGVQISPLRNRYLTRPSVSGVCSVLDHVHQVQFINS